MSSKSSYIYDSKRLFWVTRTPNTSNALLPSLHSQHIKFVALVVWESITTKMTDDNSTTLSETIKLILLDDHSVTSVLSSPSLLEQRMKVWKKKGKKRKSLKGHPSRLQQFNLIKRCQHGNPGDTIQRSTSSNNWFTRIATQSNNKEPSFLIRYIRNLQSPSNLKNASRNT